METTLKKTGEEGAGAFGTFRTFRIGNLAVVYLKRLRELLEMEELMKNMRDGGLDALKSGEFHIHKNPKKRKNRKRDVVDGVSDGNIGIDSNGGGTQE